MSKTITCLVCKKEIYVMQEKFCLTCEECGAFYIWHPKEKRFLLVAAPPYVNKGVWEIEAK